jgi:predicted RNA-binding Zn-ribbon protein involved in translation (DUF1610 family)
MANTVCPDCAIEMHQIEKTTFTGRDMREYQCPKCGRKQIVDCGKALWRFCQRRMKTQPRNKENAAICRLAATAKSLALSPDSRSFSLIRG